MSSDTKLCKDNPEVILCVSSKNIYSFALQAITLGQIIETTCTLMLKEINLLGCDTIEKYWIRICFQFSYMKIVEILIFVIYMKQNSFLLSFKLNFV